ncbi:hypothetical protein AWT69_002385 [Pseudomonas putida]|nr:hypothetical protein AWT69_002385 [Pseudomonas putida]
MIRCRGLSVRGHRGLPALLLIFQVKSWNARADRTILSCKITSHNWQICRAALHFCHHAHSRSDAVL